MMSKQKFESLFFTKISKSLPSNGDANSIVRSNQVCHHQELIRSDMRVGVESHISSQDSAHALKLMKESNRPYQSKPTFKIQKLQGELKYSLKTFVTRLLGDGREHC